MLSYRYLLCFGIVISMTSALGCNRMTSLPPENEVQASDAILPQNDAQQPVAELSNGEQPVMPDAQQPNFQTAETPTADADEDSVTPEDALAKRIREYDVNEYKAHTDYEKVYLFPKQYPDGYSNGQCRAANCKCGENTCLRDEYCVKDRCKTKFDHDIMMEPTRLDAAEVVDNGDYWECAAESCKYTYNPRTAYPKNEAINYTTSGSTKTITLPRGVRARGNDLYCGGERLPAEQFDKSKCTDDGWICYAPNGCSHYFNGGEHEDSYNVTCSPGQHLEDDDYLVAKSDGHNMSLWGYCENRHATDENVKYCPTENCECGEHLCGKNQYCAFGHCYYQGKIYQGFGDYQFVELQGSECDDDMTTTRSSSIINHIVCNRPEGCHCRNEGRAPKDAEVCKENLLNIEFNKPESGNYAYVQYDSSSEGCPESIFFLWQCSESQDSSTCLCGNTTCPAGAFCANGTCYLDFVAGKFLYKPKPAHDDYIAKDYMWKCAPGKSCQCDDRQLPANAHCYIDLNGKEHAVWGEWIPQNYPSVSDEYFVKACSTDDCICNGQKLPENAVCHVDPQREWIACGNDRLDNITGYRCDAKTKKWLCADEINGCLCGDRKLPLNTYCKQISDRDAETFCGDKIMPRTEGHLCVNDKIVCGKPDGECMCGDRKLPPNTSCVLHFDEWSGKRDYDMALYGDKIMLLSEGYECINNKITCTKPDGDCLCVGHHSVDAENAECKAVYNREAKTFEEVYTCAQTHYYIDDILYKDHAVHYSTFEFHDFED
ncbi:MAG: hypothetical protein J6A01_11235, partial [Proteobacteria bacterium]|nr:hypothetical protein [Pseudomonadota bacterium]